MEPMISGDTELVDSPIIPGEFSVKEQRTREGGVAFHKGRRKKPEPPQKSAHFMRLKAEILSIRPDFNCDWDSMSEAILANIVRIERNKHHNHFPMHEQPRIVPAANNGQQEQVNIRILAGLEALTKTMAGFNRRLKKLEKGK